MRSLAAHTAHDLRAGNLELVSVTTPTGRRLRLYGELDLSTAPDLLAASEEALRAQIRSLELDLGALEFLDSTGLGAILTIAALCVERGTQLTLLSPRRSARRLLAVAHVSERLVIRDA